MWRHRHPFQEGSDPTVVVMGNGERNGLVEARTHLGYRGMDRRERWHLWGKAG